MMLLLASLFAALAGPLEELKTAANDDLDEPTRMAAFERLVRHGATDLRAIRKVAEDDQADARQRWVAVRALGKIRGPQATESLELLLENDMPAMRAAAASAVGDLGDKGLSDEVAGKLTDPAIMVRAASAEALGSLKDPATIDELEAALADSSNFYRGSSLWVRKHYVEALGQIGDRKALPVLLRTLDDADETVVQASIDALERVSGFSYDEGRDRQQEIEAWRRWVTAEIRTNPPM